MSNYLASLTDLHILESDISKSVVYPGPKQLDMAEKETIEKILHHCQKIGKKDFVVSHSGLFWRGRHDPFAVDGQWYRLRKMPEKAFGLNELPSPMHPILIDILTSSELKNGGLIYFVGSPGSGKTSSASATLVSRLRKFAGTAYTIEAPTEFPLNGWHNEGYCTQTQVTGEQSEDWAEAFRCVLRSQPVGENLILYVGEVRDAESAAAMLRAASNGFLVIATGFGSDLISGLDALVKLAGSSAQSAIAALLRVLVYQKIDHGIMIPNVLVSRDASSQVGIKIAGGMLQHLQSDIQRQANMLHMKLNPFEVHG